VIFHGDVPVSVAVRLAVPNWQMELVPVNEPVTVGLVVITAEPEMDDEDVVHPLPSVNADIEYVVGELTGVTEIT